MWTFSTIGIIKSKCFIVKFCNLPVEDYLSNNYFPRSDRYQAICDSVNFDRKDLTTVHSRPGTSRTRPDSGATSRTRPGFRARRTHSTGPMSSRPKPNLGTHRYVPPPHRERNMRRSGIRRQHQARKTIKLKSPLAYAKRAEVQSICLRKQKQRAIS